MISEIIWREAYNCYSAKIADGAITLSVVWNSIAPKGSPSGYVVTVNNRRLKELVPDVEAGKQAAYRLARKIIGEAAAALDES